MPTRLLKESVRTSPNLARLSHGGERCFTRLLTTADDFGRFLADPAIVRGACFPLVPGVTEKHVADWLREMDVADLVQLYQVDGRAFGWFRTWDKHQTRRAKHSKYPAPPALANTCTQMQANAPVFVFEERIRIREVEESGNGEPLPAIAGVPAPDPRLTPDGLKALWNEHVPKPRVSDMTAKRTTRARRRIAEHPSPDWWRTVIAKVAASSFLRGGGPRKWQATFDWLLESDNAVRVLEGAYDDAAGRTVADRAAEIERELIEKEDADRAQPRLGVSH